MEVSRDYAYERKLQEPRLIQPGSFVFSFKDLGEFVLLVKKECEQEIREELNNAFVDGLIKALSPD
ncbi:hypothetical protein SAMN05444392_102333 [Seinonella peptonophila]|uniref:Uncharacterized protein n=1 Tax=Seinonella peptonophila TaxID=112248 RepID=A0A1M4VFF7_9BACL|nr:hypothetical protein [Seinonella peptonophila]SHE67648.1 hypothetical protein SAMN05444392_102333 [Seinonella peptonophila]